MNIKQYPTCYYTHRALDALLDLLRRRPVPADQVRRIDVSMSREHATVLRNHAPSTALAAKFSIEFAMAAALVQGKVGLVELDDSFVLSDAVQRLFPLVHVTHAQRYDAATPGAAWAASPICLLSVIGIRSTFGPTP